MLSERKSRLVTRSVNLLRMQCIDGSDSPSWAWTFSMAVPDCCLTSALKQGCPASQSLHAPCCAALVLVRRRCDARHIRVSMQAQVAYEMSTSAFTFGKLQLVCNGFTRQCQAQNQQNRRPNMGLWPSKAWNVSRMTRLAGIRT